MSKLEPVRKLKSPDGRVIFYLNGKIHNWDEAAVVYPDGKKEYWLFGYKYTKDEWTDRKRDSNGIPPAKNPKYDTRL